MKDDSRSGTRPASGASIFIATFTIGVIAALLAGRLIVARLAGVHLQQAFAATSSAGIAAAAVARDRLDRPITARTKNNFQTTAIIP